jgi:hypothetical protein
MGNNSKIIKSRVIILMHCTPPEWDLYTYEVSCWYLIRFLSYALKHEKITKVNNWNKMQCMLSFLCVALLLNKIYPPMKFQFDTSLHFFEISSGQKVWKITKGNNSKILKGRVIILAHGRMDEDYIFIPASFRRGDNTHSVNINGYMYIKV